MKEPLQNILPVSFNNFEEIITFSLYNNKTKTDDEIIIPFNQNKWTLTHCKYLVKKYNEIYNLNQKHKEYIKFERYKYNPTIYLSIKYILDIQNNLKIKNNYNEQNNNYEIKNNDSENNCSSNTHFKQIKLNYLPKNIYKYIDKMNKTNEKINQGCFKMLLDELIYLDSEKIYKDNKNNYYKKIELELKVDSNINKSKNIRQNTNQCIENNKNISKKQKDEQTKYYWSLTNFDIQHSKRHKYRSEREVKVYLDCSNNKGNRAFLKYYYSNPILLKKPILLINEQDEQNKQTINSIYYPKSTINKMLIYETRNIMLDNIFYDYINNNYYIKINY